MEHPLATTTLVAISIHEQTRILHLVMMAD